MKTFDEGYHIIPRGAEYRGKGQTLYVTLENGEEYCFLPGAIVQSQEAIDKEMKDGWNVR